MKKENILFGIILIVIFLIIGVSVLSASGNDLSIEVIERQNVAGGWGGVPHTNSYPTLNSNNNQMVVAQGQGYQVRIVSSAQSPWMIVAEGTMPEEGIKLNIYYQASLQGNSQIHRATVIITGSSNTLVSVPIIGTTGTGSNSINSVRVFVHPLEDDGSDNNNGGDNETVNGGDNETVNGGDNETVNGGDNETVNGGDNETVNGGDNETVNGGDNETVNGGDNETVNNTTPPEGGFVVGPQRPVEPGVGNNTTSSVVQGPGGGVAGDLREAGGALRVGDQQRAGAWLIAAGEDLLDLALATPPEAGGVLDEVAEDLIFAGEDLIAGDEQAAAEDLIEAGEDLEEDGNYVDMKKTGIPSMYIAIILILLSIVTLIIHKKK